MKFKTSLWWLCCSLRWTHDLTLIIKTSEALSQGSPKPISDQVLRAYACKQKSKSHSQSHIPPKHRTHFSIRRVSTALRELLVSMEQSLKLLLRSYSYSPQSLLLSLDLNGHIHIGLCHCFHQAGTRRHVPSHMGRDCGNKLGVQWSCTQHRPS